MFDKPHDVVRADRHHSFENQDGSFNLLFDFIPTDMQSTTLQLRDSTRSGASARTTYGATPGGSAATGASGAR